MKIEGCAFGSIVIDGRRYTTDLVIYPDGRVEGSWYRKRGHRLSSGDIIRLIESDPEVIVAGTGVSGMVRPDQELEKLLDQRGIGFYPEANERAMELFNGLWPEKRVGACFHLTC